MPAPTQDIYKPGIHSFNRARFAAPLEPARGQAISIVIVVLALLGIGGLGYYAYTLADQRIYQAYANWSFEQQIAGFAHHTFRDYVRSLAGAKNEAPPVTPSAETELPQPAAGAIIGRVEIGRLHLSAIVRQGVDDATLRDSVGHVPSTALPGQIGNFAIAAHRDTLFRALKDIQKDDLISFQSAKGTFTYQVRATKIVKPTDVSVLRPDGGGMIQAADENPKLLTMITCYPFYYVGSAPKRFIVEAQLVTPDSSENSLPKPPGMVK
jgi:sortase A